MGVAGRVLLAWRLLSRLTGRYAQDVATNVLIYICLGLGLNVVVGLAGMLDLGYIAFYGVGAYTYAMLNIHFGMSFWICLPFAATGHDCRMHHRIPHLAHARRLPGHRDPGFGEIVRIILNNWMTLTNGPNGILGVKSAQSILAQLFEGGFSIELFILKSCTICTTFYWPWPSSPSSRSGRLNVFKNRHGPGNRSAKMKPPPN
jgi:branched-chain amino acid transport system permease protein